MKIFTLKQIKQDFNIYRVNVKKKKTLAWHRSNTINAQKATTKKLETLLCTALHIVSKKLKKNALYIKNPLCNHR